MDRAAYTCIALLITGALLWATRYAPHLRTLGPKLVSGREPPSSPAVPGTEAVTDLSVAARATDVTPWIALAVGIAQGLAVFPGISRSGATIAVALLLGVGRADAARFAFLLSIPAILGALALEGEALADLGHAGVLPLVVGIAAAVVAGYLSLALLVALVRRGGLHHFTWYVVPLGIAGLILLS
jgi:undecaprenyl-diphosphatase